MPGWFVTAIVVAVLALIAGAVWTVSAKKCKKDSNSDVEDARAIAKLATFVLLALAVVATFISSATVVSTKNVGIETTFGRPTGSLSNGFHLIAPWDKVSEMDAAIQTDSHTKDNHNACVDVRIAHQTVACVDVSIKWRIQDGAADSLYQNYRGFDNVRDSLVTRELNVALNTVFETYDPLAVDDNGNSISPSLNALATKVQQQMQQEIGAQINVLSVMVPVVHFDDATQGRVNALQAQIAQTRIAEQAEKTAAAQAAANKALSGSVSNDPNVLVDKCLNILNEIVSKGGQLPAGFSCWGPSSASVAVPAK